MRETPSFPVENWRVGVGWRKGFEIDVLNLYQRVYMEGHGYKLR